MSSTNEIRFRTWPELELKIETLKERMQMGSEKELIVFLINSAYLQPYAENLKE